MALKHLYLPKLITGASISEPANDAVWDNKDHQIIKAISDGIEVDETAQTKGVSSVPDIYARPLTFLGGFRSEKHPLRKRIVQEWRGLLSLLALHSIKPDLRELKITVVNLADERLQQEKFPKALVNLADKPVKLEKNGTSYLWTDFLLIKFQDIPLGAFSPATLVYTSADYNKKLSKFFPLQDENGYLKPPAKGNGLDAVGKWLENFIDGFNALAQTTQSAAGDHKYVGDINKMLDEWLRDIKAELGVAPNEKIKADSVRIDDDIIESLRENPPQVLRKYAIYRLMLIPVVEDESKTRAAYRSDYSLQMARNKTDGLKEIIVITAALLGRNQNLWRGTSPSELDKEPAVLIDRFFSSASGNRINNINLEKDNAIWIRPELFFLTDTLLKGQADNILDEGEKFLNDDSTEFILPFKKEVLQFFSPEEIKQLLKPHYDIGNTKVVFSFTLPLVNNQKIEIRKTYRNRGETRAGGEGVITELQVPVIEIFPDYSGDFWCQYFLMNSAVDTFSVQPVNYDVKPMVSEKQTQSFESKETKVKIDLQRISGFNSFPEAVELVHQQTSTGLILLRRDPDFKNDRFDNEDKVTIGVDFGTSNTNIYYLKNGIPSKTNLAFADYTRRLTNPNKFDREEIEKQFFVPVKNVELPIPTTLRRYYLGKSEYILFDHFIYFPTAYKYDKNVSSNIKWDSDDSKMRCFIESLVFLLLLDIVHKKMGNITVKCTYPKSFSDQMKSAYNRTWEVALQTAMQVSDDIKVSQHHRTLLYNHADPGERAMYIDKKSQYILVSNTLGRLMIDTSPEFVSEGEATGYYFSSKKIYNVVTDRANKTTGAICIDVGGGTTDYSLWFGGKIVYDCSVYLAGGQISEVIAANPRLYSLLFSEEAAKALQPVIDNPVQFSSVLNYTLKKEGKDIAARIINNVNSREMAWLRRAIAIEFGALAFFAGHIALAVSKYTGNGTFKDIVRENGIRLHWGGNAAKLISWIDYGKYDPDGIAAKFLNALFRNAVLNPALGEDVLEIKPSLVSQVQSINHKDEAAGGSVLMEEIRKEQDAGEDMEDEGSIYGSKKETKMEGLVLSEPMVINGKQYSHYDTRKRSDFFDKDKHASLVESLKLEQFEEFINVLNVIGMRFGLFPEDHQVRLSDRYKIALRAEILARFNELAAMEESKRIVQPPFITAVSQYLKEYINVPR